MYFLHKYLLYITLPLIVKISGSVIASNVPLKDLTNTTIMSKKDNIAKDSLTLERNGSEEKTKSHIESFFIRQKLYPPI
jgi:hypothetical protein